MRKVMLLAAMLAMVLVVASPVLAQDFEQEAEAEATANVSYAICTQVIQAVNAQNQYVNQQQTVAGVAIAGDEGEAEANVEATQVAAQLGISVDAVNACLFNFATATPTPTPTVKTVTPHAKKKVVWIEGKKFFVVAGKTVTATATATPTATVVVKEGGGGGGTAKAAVLPETGGASLLALGAGALLVGGGLLARRIAR